MSNDHSIIIVVPDAQKEVVSKVLSAKWGDDPPGIGAFAVQLSADGNGPPTHWLLHYYDNNGNAATLMAMPVGMGNVPPGLNLVPYGITEEAAKAACNQISRVSVKTGAVAPGNHVQDILTDLGLVEIA